MRDLLDFIEHQQGISIAATGVGLKPDEVPLLFEPRSVARSRLISRSLMTRKGEIPN